MQVIRICLLFFLYILFTVGIVLFQSFFLFSVLRFYLMQIGNMFFVVLFVIYGLSLDTGLVLLLSAVVLSE